MVDTDKHPALIDLRERLGRVEGSVSKLSGTVGDMREAFGNMALKVETSCASVSKEISQLIHENDVRALEAKAEESEWKAQHAVAVQNCETKGKTAEEAKILATKAIEMARKTHRLAVGMTQPKGSKPINWAALIVSITALLSALAAYIQGKT